MQYLPEKDYDLPDTDLLSLIFESPLSWTNEDTILNAEAADEINQITKAEARTITKRLAYVFRQYFGIGKNGSGNDVVVCMSSGQILLPTIFYGVIGAGGVYSAASSAFTSFELSRQVKQGKASLLVASTDCKDVAVKTAKECGITLDRVLILESMGHRRDLKDAAGGSRNYLWETKELEWERVTDPETLVQRRICLLYSSGTTGPPKGVNVSHTNMVTEALIPQFLIREYHARRKEKDPTYDFQYRTIGHLPAAHIAGVQGYFVNPAVAGGPIFWMPKFDFPKFLEYCKRHQVTFFFTVPPIYLLIAKSPDVTDQFKTLVHAVSGAAPMGAELQKSVQEKLGCPVSQTWGLSETTGSITLSPWDQNDLTGSVSPLLPNTRMRIVDDDDEKDVEEGKEGEFIVKGPVVTTGYWDNPEATAESFTADGWFKTGDIGIRRNGMFYVVDRKKELIKYKGLQVAPAEIEACLLAHDKILDAAVIGVSDPEAAGNELPRAYVVADKNKIGEQEIKDYIKGQLAQHKQLRGGIVYIDAIPKSPSGKILRRELRDWAKKEAKGIQAKL